MKRRNRAFLVLVISVLIALGQDLLKAVSEARTTTASSSLNRENSDEEQH